MIVDEVSDYLGLERDTINSMCNRAPTTYKRYEVSKASGGQRVIYQPSRKTKSLQYALIELYLEDLNVNDVATAYRRGVKSPQLKTAEQHSNYSFSLRIDFEDFFYSIEPDDLYSCLQRNGVQLVQRDEEFLRDALFIKHHDQFKLAIGAPSSPSISNAVMYPLDEQMRSESLIIDPESALTRYADDVVFSTNIKGACNDFLDRANEILDGVDSPNLTLNTSKTSFMSRGNRRVIAGLVICPDGRISIGRSKKRYIRKLLHEFQLGRLDPDQQKSLQGYLAYILDVEPDLYNRLAMKYSSDLLDQVQNSNGGQEN